MNKHIKLLVRLIISFGIITYIFSYIPTTDVVSALKKTHILIYIAALALVFLTQLANAYRMKLLLARQQIFFTTLQVFKINSMSTFYGFFLPGTLAGGAVRWYKLKKTTQKGAETLISIVFNRLIQTAGCLALGCVYFLLDKQAHEFKFIGTFLFGLLTLILAIILLLANEGTARALSAWINTIPLIPKTLKTKIHRVLDAASRYDKGLHALFMKIVLLTIIGQLSIVLGQYFLILSLDIKLTLINIGWIRSIIALLLLLPISFSGIGVREGALIYFLNLYGVPGEEAVALSFLMLSRLIILAVFGGCLEFKHHLFSSNAS